MPLCCRFGGKAKLGLIFFFFHFQYLLFRLRMSLLLSFLLGKTVLRFAKDAVKT